MAGSSVHHVVQMWTETCCTPPFLKPVVVLYMYFKSVRLVVRQRERERMKVGGSGPRAHFFSPHNIWREPVLRREISRGVSRDLYRDRSLMTTKMIGFSFLFFESYTFAKVYYLRTMR